MRFLFLILILPFLSSAQKIDTTIYEQYVFSDTFPRYLGHQLSVYRGISMLYDASLSTNTINFEVGGIEIFTINAEKKEFDFNTEIPLDSSAQLFFQYFEGYLDAYFADH